jgi:hypothetical protein
MAGAFLLRDTRGPRNLAALGSIKPRRTLLEGIVRIPTKADSCSD